MTNTDIMDDEILIDEEIIETETTVVKKKKKSSSKMIYYFIGGFLILAIIYSLFFNKPQVNVGSAVGVTPPTLDTTPGGEIQQNSPNYAQTLRNANDEEATAALEAGQTYIPTPEGNSTRVQATVEVLPDTAITESDETPEEVVVATRKRPVIPTLKKTSEQPQPAQQNAQAAGQEQPPENPYIGMMSSQMGALATAYAYPSASQMKTTNEGSGGGKVISNVTDDVVYKDGSGPAERQTQGASLETNPSIAPLEGYSETISESPGESVNPLLAADAGTKRNPSSGVVEGNSNEEYSLDANGNLVRNSGYVGDNIAGTSSGSQSGKVYIAAGDMSYGQVLATVTSDMPLPVIAEITVGKHKGARLRGTFSADPTSGKLVVAFSQMTKGDVTVPVDALAVDGYTADTAVRSKIERRYLKRYGPVFASTFLGGLAEGMAEPEQRVIEGEDGQEVVNKPRTNEQAAWKGVAAATNKISGDIAASAPKGPKITLSGGYPIGILFMDDLRTDPDAKNLK